MSWLLWAPPAATCSKGESRELGFVQPCQLCYLSERASFFLFQSAFLQFSGCAGSALHGGCFSSCSEGGPSPPRCPRLLSAGASLGCRGRAPGLPASAVPEESWPLCSRAQAQKLAHRPSSCRHVGSSRTRDRTCVSHIGRQVLYH